MESYQIISEKDLKSLTENVLFQSEVPRGGTFMMQVQYIPNPKNVWHILLHYATSFVYVQENKKLYSKTKGKKSKPSRLQVSTNPLELVSFRAELSIICQQKRHKTWPNQ